MPGTCTSERPAPIVEKPKLETVEKILKVVTFEDAEIHEFPPLQLVPAAEKQDDRGRSGRQLEAIALKKDIGDLAAMMVRMSETHQSQMSNLRCKLAVSADAMQQGVSSLTEQMAMQTSCLTDAFQVNRLIPNDAPV